MKYFFLDTSNSRLLLAIYKNKNCLAYYNEPCDNNLSANIMPIIDKIFTELLDCSNYFLFDWTVI